MSDDIARPWMEGRSSDCPLDPVRQRWLESSLRWFIDQFGTKVLYRDPVLPTAAAIAVHELCHLRLQGEGRVRKNQWDGEILTDLLTVFFGFGIFSTNAAMRFARAERGFTVISRGQLDDRMLNAAKQDGYHRLGYLRSEELGYALSCYCWLRQEPDPQWARYINPGPRVHMERGLAYLGRTSAPGELPTGRLLDNTFKIGNTTVYVTHGDSGLGLLGVRFPDFPVRRLGG